MRFLYGIIAAFLWCMLGIIMTDSTNIRISNEMQMLSTAIVIAGALAGGDGK